MVTHHMLAFMGAMSPMHWLIIGLVALLLFGNRLPEIARKMGRSINEFKKGLKEVQDGIDRAGEDDDASEERPRPRLRESSERDQSDPVIEDRRQREKETAGAVPRDSDG